MENANMASQHKQFAPRMRLLAIFTVSLFVLSGCSASNYSWGWHAVLPYTDKGMSNLKFLLGGMWTTVLISIVSIMFSVIIGMIVSLGAMSKHKGLRVLNRLYVEVFRSIPVLVMILWVYYGLPVLLGISLEPFAAGVVALVLCDSAFQAEIFRGGIQSIRKGQTEASDALGLNYLDRMRFVIMPQAITRILPPLGNQFVYMLKMSSLVSVIGLMELTRRANELTVVEYRPLEIYTILLVEYLILIVIASYGVRRLEKRLNVAG
jgi:polar amino acid transport system permease protein